MSEEGIHLDHFSKLRTRVMARSRTDNASNSGYLFIHQDIITPLEYSCHKKSPYFKRLLNEMSAPYSCSLYKGKLSPTSRLEAENTGILLVPDMQPDLKAFKGYILGPPDSPYERAVYEVSMVIPDDYPYKAPRVTFTENSRPWHPNVSSASGYICCTLLSNWKPTTSLKNILMGLQFLLQCPNWDSPQDQQVQIQFRQDPKEYDRKARLWAKEKALPRNYIESIISHVPILTDELQSAESERSHGNKPMQSCSVTPVEGSKESSKAGVKVLGSFRMSTKKEKRSTTNHDRSMCSNICPVQ
jgi:ubiquitin-conjugating enzyme (huntingtin interacting protein 2)